jgi:ribosomal protein L39E
MKKNIFLSVGFALIIVATTQVSAQVTNPNNTATPLPQFVGFDGAGPNIKPLDIRNDFNQNINIFRNGLNRMQFQTENWTGLNGLNVPNANRIMIELENNNVVPAWSMLHLRDGGVSQFMRRDWFNVGTTFDTAVDLGFQRVGCH